MGNLLCFDDNDLYIKGEPKTKSEASVYATFIYKETMDFQVRKMTEDGTGMQVLLSVKDLDITTGIIEKKPLSIPINEWEDYTYGLGQNEFTDRNDYLGLI